MVASTSSSTTSAPAGSQISPVNEKLYHQSNLIGDWTGTYSQNKQKIEFKVLSIKGTTAQVEYTHNGHVDRGTATVDKNMVTFDNVTIATRNGTSGVIELSAGSAKFTGTLTKNTAASTATTSTSPLVGTWSGIDSVSGAAASVTVKSVTGSTANVTFNVAGKTTTGTADVYKNIVRMGNVQIAVNPDTSAKVTYTKLGQTLTVAVKPYKSASTSTTSTFA
jgi:hypothetical protein